LRKVYSRDQVQILSLRESEKRVLNIKIKLREYFEVGEFHAIREDCVMGLGCSACVGTERRDRKK